MLVLPNIQNTTFLNSCQEMDKKRINMIKLMVCTNEKCGNVLD